MSERASPRRRRTPPRARATPIGCLLAALLLQALSAGCTDAPTASAPGPSPAASPPTAAASAADLSEDTARAPTAPALEIDAEPGALRFRWRRPTRGTHTSRLLVHDDRDGIESVLSLEPVSGIDGGRLPLSPHRTPWRDLSYRLETCSPSGCLSSRRERVRSLAEKTFGRLRPTLAATGERYGEAMAISADGALLALGLPTAGRVALWFTRTRDARRGGTIDVGGNDAPDGRFSRTRRLSLAASGNGDTIAVLSTDEAADEKPVVGVFRRLGESWSESARFAAFEAPSEGESARTMLQLSRDGRRLLVARVPDVAENGTGRDEHGDEHGDGGELILHELDARDRWQVAHSLHAPGTPSGRLAAASASADLRRVFVATVRGGAQPLLRLHAGTRFGQGETVMPLTGFDVDAPLSLAANAFGTRLAVGGFEPRRTGHAAAVLWRYRIDAAAGSLSATAEDSIVLGPAERGARAATLVADARLDVAAMRWTTADASRLASVVRDARGRWRTALSLPGSDTGADTGAEGPSRTGPEGGSLVVDATGERLAIGVSPGTGPPGTFDVGSVSLLR